jgi:uncharacterized protein YydD (DUF2326 family)
MYLEKLRLYETNLIDNTYIETLEFRNIQFVHGLNIITDDAQNQNGNNVGKTTTLEIINYCLAGDDPRPIYTDSKTNSENKIIKNYIEQNFVFAELTYSLDSKTRKIQRALFSKSIIKFDEQKIDLDSFVHQIQKDFFATICEKPSFRQLLPKFIRLKDSEINQPLDYNKYYIPTADKRNIRTFLFGFIDVDLFTQYSDISKKIKKSQKEKGVLCLPKTEIKKLDAEITKLGQEKLQIEDDNSVPQIMQKFIEMNRNELSISSENLNLLNEIRVNEYEIRESEKSLKRLSLKIKKIDQKELQQVYQDAHLFNAKLHHTFNEMVEFHNITIKNEINFIKNNLDLLNKKKKQLEDQQQRFINTDIAQPLYEKNKEVTKRTQSIAEKIGVLKNKILQSERTLENYNNLKVSLTSIGKSIEQNSDIVKGNVEIVQTNINKLISEVLTDKNIGVLLKYDSKNGVGFKFNSDYGDGVQQTLTILFDIAYNQMAENSGLNYPLFMLYDKTELIDQNPKKILFEKVIPNNNTQIILTALNYTLKGIDVPKNAIRLKLKQSEKLFKQ